MKSVFVVSRYLTGLFVAATVVSGCTSMNGSSIKRSDILVERLPSRPQTITTVNVYQQEATFVVSGNVTSLSPFYLPGHVDIVLCSSDGSLIDQSQSTIFGHGSSRGGEKTVRFTARLPQHPAGGSTLRLKYHAPPFGQEVALNCL